MCRWLSHAFAGSEQRGCFTLASGAAQGGVFTMILFSLCSGRLAHQLVEDCVVLSHERLELRGRHRERLRPSTEQLLPDSCELGGLADLFTQLVDQILGGLGRREKPDPDIALGCRKAGLGNG